MELAPPLPSGEVVGTRSTPIDNGDISVSPNPAGRAGFRVTGIKMGSRLTVFDISGRALATSTYWTDAATGTFSEPLASGTYVLLIEAAGVAPVRKQFIVR